MPTMRDRIRGSVLGQALGDALGAPFEFAPPGAVREATGKDWIDGLCAFTGKPGPHGPWVTPAPAGTGTDDVRYNRLFIDLVVELGGRMPEDVELARRLLDVYERPGDYFPGFEALARGQFEMWEAVSRGCLGQTSQTLPGVPPAILATRSVGLNYPTMTGLLVMPSAGLLFPQDAEAAYEAAYAAAFFDVAYAREATAVFAAAQSLALAGGAPAQILEEALGMDPLHLGGYFGGPFVKDNLPSLLVRAQGLQGHQLAVWLAAELRHFSVFDPYRALAIVFAALLAHADEPLLVLQVAANQMDVDDQGVERRYADIDCYAGIAGALVGTIVGEAALPADMLGQVLESNRSVYGIDLEEVAHRLANAASGRSSGSPSPVY